MKKATRICLVLILSILFVASIIILVANLIGSREEYTVKDILQTKFDNISYVKTGGASHQDEDYSVSKFINEYSDVKVERFSGDTGSTTHQYFVAYDSSDQILFTIVEIGNRNLLYISEGTFNIDEDNSDKLYQKTD